MYTYCNVHCYNFRATNKQVIAYQNKLIQKEEELDTMKKKTTDLQHELEYQHDLFIGIVDKLQGDITVYQAHTKKPDPATKTSSYTAREFQHQKP